MLRGKANSMKKLVLGVLSAVAMAFSMNAMAANFVAGKVVDLWVTNTSGTTQTFTHGVTATNSTVNSTTYTMVCL